MRILRRFNWKNTAILVALALLLIGVSTIGKADAQEQISASKEVEKKELTASERINEWFEPSVKFLEKFLFYDPFADIGLYDPVMRDETGTPVLGADGQHITRSIPLVVVWLVLGAVFFTFYMRFINVRGFKLAVNLVRGRYDDPTNPGEVNHFQALATALSGTVGLGNIAGVAIAVSLGGAGATFWMIVAGFLGMTSKFAECTLGVKYRHIDANGVVSGGPMYYLSEGLRKRKMAGLGKVLAVIFAILVIGGSFGGGNMFQANQAFSQLGAIAPFVQGRGIWFGILLAILVGAVIIGGIKSIAQVTGKMVPIMALLYIGTALFIVLINIGRTPEALSMIWYGAFSPDALKGGIIGVLIVGFRRAAFSNEAGVGSAAIAHAAVKTKEPITEGLVSILEPFIDTVVICTMTALVLIYTGFTENPAGLQGSQLTSAAFESVIWWFPYILTIAIFLFAFSTMISWSYYGLNGFNYLFGGLFDRVFGHRRYSKTTYQLIFLSFVVVGSSSTLGAVMDFSDMMILAMAFPNILGLLIMAPEVRRDLRSFLAKIKSGEIKRIK